LKTVSVYPAQLIDFCVIPPQFYRNDLASPAPDPSSILFIRTRNDRTDVKIKWAEMLAEMALCGFAAASS